MALSFPFLAAIACGLGVVYLTFLVSSQAPLPTPPFPPSHAPPQLLLRRFVPFSSFSISFVDLLQLTFGLSGSMDPSGLQCIICPGQPAFSDQSHIITHLESKAHVTRLYKLHLRGYKDADAIVLLNAFDIWFERNNYGQKIRDREAAKEERKNRRSSSGKKAVRSMTEDTPDASVPAVPVGLSHASEAPSALIDPRLADSNTAVKHEADTESFDPWSVTRSASTTDNIDPNLQAFPGVDPAPSTGNRELNGRLSPDATAGIAFHDAVLPVTPKPPRTSEKANVKSSQLESRTEASLIDSQVDDDEINKARLKGVQYPGMGVFDAATKEMRRKRNQKKDGTVLKQMEATSRSVEPTEQIFDAKGKPMKKRVITGNIEDDSPVKGETPIPSKGTVRAKQGMLRDLDPNLPRDSKRKRAKMEVSRIHNKNEEALDTAESEDFINRNAPFGLAFGKEDKDIGFTSRAEERRRKQPGFTVFNDNDQAPISRAPPGTLAPAQLDLHEQSNFSQVHGHNIQTSLDKENIDPTLYTHGQHDPPIWNSKPPVLKRSGSDMDGYASHHFHDANMNIGAGLADTQEDMRCYQSNPLYDPASQLNSYGYPVYGEGVTLMASSDWGANSPGMSSEATVHDEDVAIMRFSWA